MWRFPHGDKPIGTRVTGPALSRDSPTLYLAADEFGTTLRCARAAYYYRRAYAGGDDDSGVSAGGLRRRRGPRHRTRGPVAPPVRGRRALHGRAPAGRVRPPARPRAQGRQRGAVDAVGRPGDGQRRGRGHRRALAHLVHRHGRSPGGAAVRHPARADGAFARAAAAVEGRAARRRLPGVVVGGAHGGRGRRRRDRGQLGHARGRAAASIRRWTPTGCTWSATGSTPRSGIRPGPTRISPRSTDLGVDPDAADRGVRRPDHPAEGRGAPGRRGAPVRARGAAGAVRRRARHPGDRRRGDRGGANSCPRRAPACSGCGRCCRSRRFAKYSRRQRFSCARRCTSHWGS